MDLVGKASNGNLINAVMQGNRHELNLCLKKFKEGSSINYPAVLSIHKRLPAMAKENPEETLGIVVVSLTMAFETMNLSRPMNDAQVVELAETIIDSSEEDYLSPEDVLLFLQGLVRGKYGSLYESMDIPKFMEKFEIYRSERHIALIEHRREQHIQHNALPINDRLADMFPDDFKQQMRAAKIEDLKRIKPE